MKSLILIAMSLFAVNSHATIWNYSCEQGETKIIIMVDKASELQDGELTYMTKATPAKATLIIFKDGERFEYKENVYVFDEDHGGFRLQAYGFVSFEFMEVANVYYEGEGSYIVGFVKKPTFDQLSGGLIHTGFAPYADFSHIDCTER